jgi:zinc protease
MNTLRTLSFNVIIALLTLLPSLAVAIPEIQHWTTENGARIYFIPAPELPMVDVQIVFDAGSARDGDNHGLALLTNSLLVSGTEKLSADAVAESLDTVGAQLGSGASQDMAWLSLRTLSDPDYRNQSANTLAQILREPAFTSESLERERKRMIAAVQEQAQSPSDIAEKAFYQALYGNHPYAFPPGGDESGLKAIKREDIKAFYRRYYVAANAVLAIVGDLDRTNAERLASSLVGTLSRGEAATKLPPVTPLTEARVMRLSHPSSQTHIAIGQIGISRKDPDYYSLFLGNHILGGNGLVSRLAEEVRDKRGLSYGVYSYFITMKAAGPFLIGLQTRNDQVAEAEKVTKSTLENFLKDGPSYEAFELARKNITGGFALRIDSNSKFVQYLAVIGFYDLPLDHLQTFTQKINALSLEQVTDALRRHLHPEQMLTVVVGGS